MKSKILMSVLIAALTSSLGLLGKTGCDRAKLQTANDKLNEELMKANLELGRANTKFGNAEQHIDELKGQIKDEIRQRDAEMTRYGKLRARYRVLARKKRVKITETVYKDKIIKVSVTEDLDLVPGMYYEAIDEFSLKPIFAVNGDYSDHRLKLSISLFPNPEFMGGTKWQLDYDLTLKLEAQLVETYLPSGGVNHYATVWEVNDRGEKIGEFKITDYLVVVKRPNTKQWFWWAPRLDLNLLTSISIPDIHIDMGGSLGFSFFGYGLTKRDLDFRILRISVDIMGNDLAFGITPFIYNIGQFLPLVKFVDVGIFYSISPFTMKHRLGFSTGVPF